MLILNPDAYASLLRPLLFALPAEAAQKAAERTLKHPWPWRALGPLLKVRGRRLRADWCGIRLSNPVGLAAGFDKNCEMIPSLAALGFGYITVGTITLHPRPGNPKPRMVRDAKESSIVNALGFPSDGLASAARRLERSQSVRATVPVIASVSGETVDEIVRCHRRLEALVDAVEINISSPNTSELRVFHQPDRLAQLIDAVNEVRYRPLIVKLPPLPGPNGKPDGLPRERDRLMALAQVCKRRGADGLTIANTRPIEDARLSVGSGGISGRPLFSRMLEMVQYVRAEVGDGMAINACGGVFTGDDALRALQAGASTVQFYTAFVYRGPAAARAVNRELLAAMSSQTARAASQRGRSL